MLTLKMRPGAPAANQAYSQPAVHSSRRTSVRMKFLLNFFSFMTYVFVGMYFYFYQYLLIIHIYFSCRIAHKLKAHAHAQPTNQPSILADRSHAAVILTATVRKVWFFLPLIDTANWLETRCLFFFSFFCWCALQDNTNISTCPSLCVRVLLYAFVTLVFCACMANTYMCNNKSKTKAVFKNLLKIRKSVLSIRAV